MSAIVENGSRTVISEIINDNIPVKKIVEYSDPSNPLQKIQDITYGYDVNTGEYDDAGNPIIDEEKLFHFVQSQVDHDILIPTGYHLLIKTWEGDMLTQKMAAVGLVRADDVTGKKTSEKNWFETRIGLVLRVGPDAYDNRYKFPNNRWAEVGDYVMVRFHDKSLIKTKGKEDGRFNYMFVTTDDKIQLIIKDPYKVDNNLNYT